MAGMPPNKWGYLMVIQVGLEHLERWNIQNFSGQDVQKFDLCVVYTLLLTIERPQLGLPGFIAYQLTVLINFLILHFKL